ncbi:radical SAM protein, partial [Staphylococcus aureus]|nr:radical SAM protein [Staphylococcus aureus]
GYILKLQGEIIPLTRYINPADLLNNESKNTIVYEQDEGLKMQLIDIFSTGISVDKVQPKVNQLLCCLPEVCAPEMEYE